MRALIVALACFACGGKPAPKQPPPPLDAKQLAKLLDDDMSALAELTHRQRGNCGALAAELRPLTERMKLHAAEVETMSADPAKLRELRSALAAYAKQTPARTDRMVEDFKVTGSACTDDEERNRLGAAIRNIPTF
ncbi:MAG: hypothetical protein H0V17_32690 [Deltaproteobacteria bacterium]|nr:hypothetical protein [Deltaproteobacteria bacterium]